MERKGDLKAVAWRRVDRTGIVRECGSNCWRAKGECVYFMSSFTRDGSLVVTTFGTESASQYRRKSDDKIRIRILGKRLPCGVMCFLTWTSVAYDDDLHAQN